MIQSVWRKQYKFTADTVPPRGHDLLLLQQRREPPTTTMAGSARVISEVSRRLERNMRTGPEGGPFQPPTADDPSDKTYSEFTKAAGGSGDQHAGGGSSETGLPGQATSEERPDTNLLNKTVVTLESER